MNWEALGAISELLAAISVFVTLIYLAIQVKENNKVQTINTYNAVVGGFSELYSWAGATTEVASVSRYLFNEKDRELSVDERHQLDLMFHQFGNHMLRIHKLYESGVMTKSEWLPIALEMNFMINASEYGRDYRKIRPSLERVWTDIEEGAKEELKRIKSSFKPQP
ncbi:MAG: hypothetical protein CMP89_15840 [Gammaproteobacteria bacterium]|nr:hypothetical protein [Gammaproteobacteria bacterium]|tara:strand:- start:444 stop:941 length:498 start_codon:yes stop_codon:yes gene_type:complete